MDQYMKRESADIQVSMPMMMPWMPGAMMAGGHMAPAAWTPEAAASPWMPWAHYAPGMAMAIMPRIYERLMRAGMRLGLTHMPAAMPVMESKLLSIDP